MIYSIEMLLRRQLSPDVFVTVQEKLLRILAPNPFCESTVDMTV